MNLPCEAHAENILEDNLFVFLGDYLVIAIFIHSSTNVV